MNAGIALNLKIPDLLSPSVESHLPFIMSSPFPSIIRTRPCAPGMQAFLLASAHFALHPPLY